MTRIAAALVAAATALLAVSCGDASRFTVDADFENNTAPSLRVVFVGDSGLTDTTVPSDEKVRFDGHSTAPTLLVITGERNAVLARAIVAGGDKLTVKGDAADPASVTVTGNAATERWQEFRRNHADLYAVAPCAALDDSIVAYATAHRDDLAAAALLLFDHSDMLDDPRAIAAMDALAPQACPASLTASAMSLAALVPAAQASVGDLRLISDATKRFETVATAGHTTVMLFWAPIDSAYKHHMRFLENLHRRRPDVAVLDIDVDSDSARWQRALRPCADMAWRHLWAPSGPLEPSIDALAVRRVPLYLVTDSTSAVIYRGSDSTAVARAAARL